MYPEYRSGGRTPVDGRFLGASHVTIRGNLRDVSATGLCLSTSTPLLRGQVLYLEFELPTGDVELVGEVRWSTPKDDGMHELGIRIVRIPEPSAQAIRDASRPRAPRKPPRRARTH